MSAKYLTVGAIILSTIAVDRAAGQYASAEQGIVIICPNAPSINVREINVPWGWRSGNSASTAFSKAEISRDRTNNVYLSCNYTIPSSPYQFSITKTPPDGTKCVVDATYPNRFNCTPVTTIGKDRVR